MIDAFEELMESGESEKSDEKCADPMAKAKDLVAQLKSVASQLGKSPEDLLSMGSEQESEEKSQEMAEEKQGEEVGSPIDGEDSKGPAKALIIAMLKKKMKSSEMEG